MISSVNLMLLAFFAVMARVLVASICQVNNNGELLELENTNATKGIAILMIVLSHVIQYTGNYSYKGG